LTVDVQGGRGTFDLTEQVIGLIPKAEKRDEMVATLREKNEECFTADIYEGGQVTHGFAEREANTSAGRWETR